MSSVHAVLERAMTLPKGERALVAFELLSSLEGEDKDAETAWKSEIEARLAVEAAGNYEAAHWRIVVGDIRKSLHERQHSETAPSHRDTTRAFGARNDSEAR